MIVGQIQKGEKMGRTLNEDDVLKEIDRWIGYLDEDMITRIKIGIKKLQSAQSEQHEDAVSREAVYTVIEEVLYETTKGADNWYRLLNDGVRTLPPAQSYTEADIQKMQDLEQAQIEKAFELGREEAQPEQRWIPCSERLPENKSYVLTTIYVPGRQPHARSGWFEDGLFMNDNGDTWKSTDREVCAWLPLPAPYQGEGD